MAGDLEDKHRASFLNDCYLKHIARRCGLVNPLGRTYGQCLRIERAGVCMYEGKTKYCLILSILF